MTKTRKIIVLIMPILLILAYLFWPVQDIKMNEQGNYVRTLKWEINQYYRHNHYYGWSGSILRQEEATDGKRMIKVDKNIPLVAVGFKVAKKDITNRGNAAKTM